MPFEITLSQATVLVVLGVAFALLISERLRNDLVAVLIIVALAATGVLEPSEALSGFGSEPAIVVAAIFVLSAGLHATGVSDVIGSVIGRLAGASYSRILAVIMLGVALLSAFTHHVTTTALMLPVTIDLAREREIPASRLLMPLSFAASLGTTITIIRAPAFLLASEVLQQLGRPGLGIFSIAPIGLALSIGSTLFLLLGGRWLLPTREGTDSIDRFRLDDYYTEVEVLPNSPLRGKTVAEIEQNRRYSMRVVGCVRNGTPVAPPNPETPVREGDVLLVRTSADQLLTIRQDSGVELHPVAQYTPDAPPPLEAEEQESPSLIQAIVAPNSAFEGRTLRDLDFRRRYGAVVVGLWRQEGQPRRELADIRLRGGDVLVLQGDAEAIRRVAEDRGILLLLPFQGRLQQPRKALLASAIMLATILAAAFNLLSIEIATLAGAAGMILARCLGPRQAYEAIDARIYVFIAGAIPLGRAMQKSGVSDLLAAGLQAVVGGWPQLAILLAIFAVVAVLTQFMSDAATTALFAPVAGAFALAIGQPPEPYVVTVAMAAVASFLTPIGHHGNLLVYGPGRYRFADFVRVGTPLTVLVGASVCLLAPVLWPR